MVKAFARLSWPDQIEGQAVFGKVNFDFSSQLLSRLRMLDEDTIS